VVELVETTMSCRTPRLLSVALSNLDAAVPTMRLTAAVVVGTAAASEQASPAGDRGERTIDHVKPPSSALEQRFRELIDAA
jgi:hypothetical protein